MLNIKLNKTTSKPSRLAREDYRPFAMAIIQSHSTEKSDGSVDIDINAIATLLKSFSQGGTTKSGKTVSVSTLLGVISSISSELADELIKLYKSNQIQEPIRDLESF